MYNNINYAITIDTGTTLTDSDVGMYEGVMRFVTDRYVVTDDVYEDSTPVDNISFWYKDFIAKDGMAPAGININIENGGDYAYLQGYDVKLVNMTTTGTPFHLMIGSEGMQLNGVYPIGSNVQVYVIINKVWYPRWNGIVSDTVIDDEYFKFVCEDKNIKEYKLLPPNIINKTNYPNALSSEFGKAVPRIYGNPMYSKLVVTTQLIEKYLEKSFTVNRLKPNMFETAVDGAGRVSNIDSPSTYTPASLYGDAIPPYMQKWYQTGTTINDDLFINLNNNYYAIVVGAPVSFNEAQLVGKFVSISNVYNEKLDSLTDLHRIVEVKTGSTSYTDSLSTKLIYLYVEKSPVKLVDNTCLYGNITNNPSWDVTTPSNNPAIATMAEDTSSIGHAFIVNANMNGIVSDLPVIYSDTLPVDPWYDTASYESSNVFLYKSVGDGVGVFKSEFVNNESGLITCVSPFVDNDTPAHVLHKADTGKYFKYDSTKWADNFASRSINSVDNIIFDPKAYVKESNSVPIKLSSQEFNLVDEGEAGLCVNLTYNEGSRFKTYDDIEVNYAFEFMDQIVYPWGAEHALVNNSLDLISVGVHAESTDFLGNSVGSPYADIGTIPLPYSDVRFTDSDGDQGQWWFSNIVYNSKLITVDAPKAGTSWTNMQYIINPLYKGSLYVDNDRIPLWTHAGELGSQDEYFYLAGQQTTVDNKISDTVYSELSPNGRLSTWFTIEPKKQSVVNNVSSWQPAWSNLKVHYLGIGGLMSYKFSDLYLKAYDDSTNNLYTTIKSIVEDLNGITDVNYNNLESTRSSWNVGRQVTEQDNSFNYIQELCNQSYVCGWTGRDGSINFSAFREYGTSTVNHNDANIIRGSIKNLSRTPISQVFNELTFKYDWNAITDTYDGVYSIGNVDSNSFPVAKYFGWTQIPLSKDDNRQVAVTYVNYAGFAGGKAIKISVPYDYYYEGMTPVTFDWMETYKGDTTGGFAFEGVYKDILSSDDSSDYYFDPISVTIPLNNVEYILSNEILWYTELNTDFSDYVSGITSYPDAKDIWETCHDSWLESKTINKAPTSLTDLPWYVSSDDPTSDSTYKYMEQCIDWLTRQKWKINYQLPINSETVTLELMQRVNFSDAIVTGQGQQASGWITGLAIDPKTDLIDVELTFEYFIAMPPVILNQCVNIIETGSATDNIIETGSQTTNIIEGVCGR